MEVTSLRLPIFETSPSQSEAAARDRLTNTHSQRLILSRIPCTADEHKRRCDNSFCHTKEEPHGHEFSPVVANDVHEEDETPNENAGSKTLGSRKLLKKKSCERLCDHVPEIEYGSQPGILVAHEVGVFDDSEDGSVTKC